MQARKSDEAQQQDEADRAEAKFDDANGADSDTIIDTSPLSNLGYIGFVLCYVPQMLFSILWDSLGVAIYRKVYELRDTAYPIFFYTGSIFEIVAIPIFGWCISQEGRPFTMRRLTDRTFIWPNSRRWFLIGSAMQLVAIPTMFCTCVTCPLQPRFNMIDWCDPFYWILPAIYVYKVAEGLVHVSFYSMMCEVQQTRKQREHIMIVRFLVHCVIDVSCYGGVMGAYKRWGNRVSWPEFSPDDCPLIRGVVLVLCVAAVAAIAVYFLLVLPCIGFERRWRRQMVVKTMNDVIDSAIADEPPMPMPVSSKAAAADDDAVQEEPVLRRPVLRSIFWRQTWALLTMAMFWRRVLRQSAAVVFYRSCGKHVTRWYGDMVLRISNNVRLLTPNAHLDVQFNRNDNDAAQESFDVNIICWVGVVMSISFFVTVAWLRFVSGLYHHAQETFVLGTLIGGNLSMWVAIHIETTPMVGEFMLAAVLFAFSSTLMWTSAVRMVMDLLEPDVRGSPPRWCVPVFYAWYESMQHLITRLCLVIMYGLEAGEVYEMLLDPGKDRYRVHWGIACFVGVLMGMLSLQRSRKESPVL